MLFYTTGMFGWTGTPAAFDVVTRVLRKKLRSVLSGEANIYVDDILGACAQSELASDMSFVRKVVIDLLGPHSLSLDKEETSVIRKEIVWVGWGIDLKTETISLSMRNYLKCLYAFSSVETSGQV